MKATGIVRRIDDLGRVVIPKEIRRTMRIREGDPLEIYTSRDGEVIFKKYSLMGGLDDFAAQFCETLSKSCGAITAVTDRDTVIAVAGGGKRDLMGKRISPQLEQIMEDRKIYQHTGEERRVFVTDTGDKYCTAVAAPIISEGDVLGLVLFVEDGEAQVTGETEYKLAQTIAAFRQAYGELRPRSKAAKRWQRRTKEAPPHPNGCGGASPYFFAFTGKRVCAEPLFRTGAPRRRCRSPQ